MVYNKIQVFNNQSSRFSCCKWNYTDLKLILLAMTVFIVSLALLCAGFCSGEQGVVEKPWILADDFNINIKNGKIHFFLPNSENGEVLRGELAVSLGEDVKSDINVCEYDRDNCIRVGNDVTLSVEKLDQCYYINWTTSKDLTLEDCMDYGTQSWFGGPENDQQYWPFNNMTFKQSSYIIKREDNQAVAERYWVSTSGYYIFVDKSTPLFIDANNDYPNGLCLIAKQSNPYLPRGRTHLGYKICAYDNIRRAHMNAVRHELGTPTGIPDQRMIQHPIWSTWVRFKANVNETSVLKFARDIVSHGFTNSQIEIDDNWETCYGNDEFNVSRFSDMPELSSELHRMGFRITLWTHPFVNVNCDLFNTLKNKGYLVQNQNGIQNSIWWNGICGVVDFTNPDAAQWFLDHRRAMLAHNKIDNLKLDAGETSWLPQIPKLNADVELQPNAFSVAYINTVAQFGDMVEVRAGYGTQNHPIFVRMMDKDSKWTFDNGLPTLLTTLLQLNLNGYTLVLPDMVGGNAYGSDVVDKELFIRWLQANTFMPSIQFSVAPWDFDDETVEISKKFTTLHYNYSGKIIRRMEECVKTGVPVNAPVWWIAPKDPVTHTIWSEYMLGDDLLVAPVLEKGATSRDIYLPAGRWRDESDPDHKLYYGQRWLRNYPAPLDTLPYFSRISGCEFEEF